MRGGDFSHVRRAPRRAARTARAAASAEAGPAPVGQRQGPLHARAASTPSATVRGTIWSVTDRCDGTFTRVERGIVVVKDFKRKRTKVLAQGRVVPRQALARAATTARQSARSRAGWGSRAPTRARSPRRAPGARSVRRNGAFVSRATRRPRDEEVDAADPPAGTVAVARTPRRRTQRRRSRSARPAPAAGRRARRAPPRLRGDRSVWPGRRRAARRPGSTVRQSGSSRTGSRSSSRSTATENAPFDGRAYGASAPRTSSRGDVARREAPRRRGAAGRPRSPSPVGRYVPARDERLRAAARRDVPQPQRELRDARVAGRRAAARRSSASRAACSRVDGRQLVDRGARPRRARGVVRQPSPPPAAGSIAARGLRVAARPTSPSAAPRARSAPRRARARRRTARANGPSDGAARGHVCVVATDARRRASRPAALDVRVEPRADPVAAAARGRPSCSPRAGGRSRRGTARRARRGCSRRIRSTNRSDLVDGEEVVGEPAADEQRRRRAVGRDPVGRVEAAHQVDDLARRRVGVRLAGVGARDPAQHVGLRVGSRRREVAHRPPGHERLRRPAGPGPVANCAAAAIALAIEVLNTPTGSALSRCGMTA